MITEEEVDKCLDFLRDNARVAAQATANRIYMVEYRKVVKSQLMLRILGSSVAAQEVQAEADPRYAEQLQAIKEAVEQDEYLTWMMKAAEAKISAWQTQSKNLRAAVV